MCFWFIVSLALESYMPLGSIDISIVGFEGELAVTRLLASGKDIDTICRSGTVVFTILWLTINHNALFTLSWFLGIARCTIVESQTDGIE